MLKNKLFLRGVAIALVGLVLDQLSKAYILYILKLSSVYENGWAITAPFNKSLTMIEGFFNLTLVWNHGVSFGMFNNGVGGGNQPLVLIALTTAIAAVLLYCLYKAQNKWAATAFGLVIGGAIGNLIDRVIYGAVVDFLDFYIGVYHWPAFNVADSMILIGVLMLVFEGFFVKSKNHEKS